MSGSCCLPPAAPRLRPGRGGRGGMTLVEVIFSIVVMSTLLLAALGTVGAAARGRAGQRDAALGLAHARQLMAEVLQTRYRDLVTPVFGVEPGEARATFDDVDDYDGWSETSAKYADGTALPGGAGWARSVKVDWVSPADPTATSAADKGLKRVRVTVTSPAGGQAVLTALRSADDGYEHTPPAQVTYTCHVGVSVQVGPAAAGRNAQGATLLNLVP